MPKEKHIRFWMVWNPKGRAPTAMHWSKATAQAEAERLARTNPGNEFFVLKAVNGVTATCPKVGQIKLIPDPDSKIPF